MTTTMTETKLAERSAAVESLRASQEEYERLSQELNDKRDEAVRNRAVVIHQAQESGLTLKEIGEVIGVIPQRVSQIARKAKRNGSGS